MLNQYGKCSIFLTIATIYIYYIGLRSKKQGKNALSKIIKPVIVPFSIGSNIYSGRSTASSQEDELSIPYIAICTVAETKKGDLPKRADPLKYCLSLILRAF